tara:strand:+ start:331 stop:1074 length:744 start_codon:yes stop_codon:yes gene_type:complete
MGASSANAALALHYKLEDAGGSILSNANSGSASHSWGSGSGGALVTGAHGGAGDFTSASWWSSASTGVNLNSFSLSLHVRTSATTQWKDFISLGTDNKVVFVLELASAITGGHSVSLYNIGNVGGVTNAPLYTGVASGPINDGAWHHLGIVSDGATIQLFADGVQRGSTAYTGSGNIDAFQFASRFGEGSRKIVTDLDDVALYDTALSASQMSWLASNEAVVDPVPEPGTTALLGLGGLALILRRRK